MTFTRQFLEATVGDGVLKLDIEDQYQCHAFINLKFICAECGAELFADTLTFDYPGWEWCRAAAAHARDIGWFIRPPTPDGTYDLTALCPMCASHLTHQ